MESIFNEEFWVAICFVIFIILAYIPVKKAILNALDSRIDIIKRQINETKNLRDEAENLLNEAKKEINNFEEYKKKVEKSAKESTAKLIDIRSKEMELILERQKESTYQSINHKKIKTSSELSEAFTDKVISVVENYLRDNQDEVISTDDILSHLKKVSVQVRGLK